MKRNPFSSRPNRWAVAAVWLLLAGAGPAFAQFEITNISRTAGVTTLAWPSLGTGQVYTVQSRGWLEHGLWLTASDQRPWPVSATEWMDQRLNAGTNRFYRVIALPAAERGKILSFSRGADISLTQLAFLYNMGVLPVSPKYSVRCYKIIYETVNPLGGRVQASGALALPGSLTRSWPLASYQHGTITQTNQAPSALDLDGEFGIGVIMATSGYAAVLPDYLGMGNSSGLHPYHHARSEATASVDMLRAARQVCAREGYTLNGQLFLCGYSQGGHATMALHRELELFHTNEFAVTAAAPMAGAYDLSGTTADDFLSGRSLPSPYYFAYLLAAYQEVYQFTGSLTNWLAAPYDRTLPPLLNGNSSGSQIDAAMPADVSQIFKPEVLAEFLANPNHPLRLALRDNDLYDWTPRAPLRLYHCGGDQDVLFANSQIAWNHFQNLGATQVELINPLPAGDHGDCVMPSLLLAKTWFDGLKQ